MIEQTSIEVFFQSIELSEQLTRDQMKELIHDLEELKRTLNIPRYINAIDLAIDFLRLQVDLEQSEQLLKQSLRLYSNGEFLKNRWKKIQPGNDLLLSIWHDLTKIIAITYRLEDKMLLKQYAEQLLRQLNLFIEGRMKNPQDDIKNCLTAFEKACDGRISSLTRSNKPEDRELSEYYTYLKTVIDVFSKSCLKSRR